MSNKYVARFIGGPLCGHEEWTEQVRWPRTVPRCEPAGARNMACTYTLLGQIPTRSGPTTALFCSITKDSAP